MRRALGIGIAATMVAASLALVTASVSASAAKPVPKANATVKTGGPQHWCGTNGIECTEPATDWDEYAGYAKAIHDGAHINGYIGHDEPATLFYSNTPGAGNDVTYQLRLPKDPPPSQPRTAAVAPTASSCTRRSGWAW